MHFKNNLRVFNANADGITNSESLLASDRGGNSMNWITGHMAVTRESIFTLLGLNGFCNEVMVEKYK